MNNTIQNLIDDLVMHDINYIGSSPYNNIISPINTQTILNPKYLYTVFKSNNQYYIITNTNIITPYGLVNTIIGSDYNNRGTINGTGQSARLFSPFGLSKYNNNIYFCEASNLVRIANNSYTTQTIAGLNNELLNPYNMIISNNYIYFTDTDNSAIKKINLSNNNIQTITGPFKSPKGITIDNNNIIYISDLYDNSIYQLFPNNIIKLFIQDGLDTPICLSCDNNNNIYIIEYFGKIKKITNNKNIITIAGNNTIKSIDGNGTYASFHFPQSITIDPSNNIYIGEWFKIRKIDTNMNVTTVAGGDYNYFSNNYTNSYFNVVSGLVYNDNKLYISDSNNNNIRTFSFDSKYEHTIKSIYEMSTGTLYKILEAIYKYLLDLLNKCLDKLNILSDRIQNLRYKLQCYDEENHKTVLDQIVLKPIDVIKIENTINIYNNTVYNYNLIDTSYNTLNTFVIYYQPLIFKIFNNVDTLITHNLSEYGTPIKINSFKTTTNESDIINDNNDYPLYSFDISNVIYITNPITTITNYVISINNMQSIKYIIINDYLYNTKNNQNLYYYYDNITNTNHIQIFKNNVYIDYNFNDFITNFITNYVVNLNSINIIVFNNIMVKLINNTILSFDPTPIYLIETLYLVNNIIVNVTKKSEHNLNYHAEYNILKDQNNNYYLDRFNSDLYYYNNNTIYTIKETNQSKYFYNNINQIGNIFNNKFIIDYTKLYIYKTNDSYNVYSNKYQNIFNNTRFIIKDNNINIYFDIDNLENYVSNNTYKMSNKLYKFSKIVYNTELNEFINMGYKITEITNEYFYYFNTSTNKLYTINNNIITNKKLALNINNQYKVYNIDASGYAVLVLNNINIKEIYIIDNKYLYYNNENINNIIMYNNVIDIKNTSILIAINNNTINNYLLNPKKITLIYNKDKEYKLVKSNNEGYIIHPTKYTFVYSRLIINNKAYTLNNFEDLEIYNISSYILMLGDNSNLYISKNVKGNIDNSNIITSNTNHVIIYTENNNLQSNYLYLLSTTQYNNMITYIINPMEELLINVEYHELYKFNNDGTVSLYDNNAIIIYDNNNPIFYKNNQPIQNQLINYNGDIVYTDNNGYMHILENDSLVAFKNFILNNSNYNYVLTKYDLSNNVFNTNNIDNIECIYYMYDSKIYKPEVDSGFNSMLSFTDIYFVVINNNTYKLYYNELEYNVNEGTIIYVENSDNCYSIYNGLYLFGADRNSSIIKWRWFSTTKN
jgi:hypothetical protein